MRFFNTVGALDPKKHYFLPHRLNWNLLTSFIEKEYYFVLHAPRQSGKTTAILELVRQLNEEGKHNALYISCEQAHPAVNDVKAAMQALLEEFKDQITDELPQEKKAIDYLKTALDKEVTVRGIYNFLRFWAQECWTSEEKKPLALFFDEFDGLMGDTLISLLKQFRSGYTKRPEHFPKTICLIGVRDLRDYKIKTKLQEELGVLYSPFNIKAESLILSNFSLEDIRTLYKQHTEETGQVFRDEAIAYAFEQTEGQPWLVNALAYQACFRDVEDRSIPITQEILERAKEALIKRCDTHMDALLDRLSEPRVRNIIDIILSGSEGTGFSHDDLLYVRDLGLIHREEIRIANSIYQEIIPRALAYTKQEEIMQKIAWYQNKDGSLDMTKLLTAFTEFYRESSDIWLEKFAYKEAGPHILLLAFIQRIINGGGRIHREYALGRRRVDLRIDYKTQRFIIELKVKRKDFSLPKSLEQTADYMDKSAATEGHLVIFDRDVTKSWEERITHTTEQFQGKTINVWGM